MPRKITAAARLKALIASLIADLSPDGVVTEAELAFVRLAGALMMRAEEIALGVGRGEQIDDGELVRLTNSAARIVRDLRDTKDRRAAAKPFNAAEHFRSFGIEPDVEDDAEGEVEPEPVDTSSEPTDAEIDRCQGRLASILAEPEPEPIAPPKRQGPVEVWLDSRSGPTGQTLSEALEAVRQGAPKVRNITLTTPASSAERSIDADMIGGVFGVGALAGRQQWFIKGLA
jgi:hypothetical protein